MTDTADLYTTTTGLIERSAAAYASGVPEGAGDDGFFLDAMVLGQPGVLEARQRITLRMRAGRPA